jgi:hypothetical protein
MKFLSTSGYLVLPSFAQCICFSYNVVPHESIADISPFVMDFGAPPIYYIITGPATILRSVGTRPFVVKFTDNNASMISLLPPKEVKDDPSDVNLGHKPPHLRQTLALSPIEEGEYVIIKDSKSLQLKKESTL